MKNFYQKILPIFCIVTILVQGLQILYFNRGYFLKPIDLIYWQDRFEHSQWQLPLSRRSIGDDGLYLYIGNRLIKGMDPSKINAEMPPLGKYLIGLSLSLFKTPAYYAFLMGIGALGFFYLISLKLLKNKNLSLLVTTLFFLEPLFFTQLWKAWLDIAQLFFLLTNIFFLLKFLEKENSLSWVILASANLGFFAVTKTPLLAPLFFLLEFCFFLYRRKFKELVIFIFASGLAVLLTYFRYFVLGHSLIDFLKLQKYILSFYLQSNLRVRPWAIWQTLFFGRFPQIALGYPTLVNEWNWFWPILTVVSLIMAVLLLFKKQNNYFWKGISFLVMVILIIYSLIPAYPRYLLIIFPFFYLLFFKAGGQFFKKIIFFPIVFFLFISGLFHVYSILIPKPNSLLEGFYYNFSHQFFHDIYEEDISKNIRQKYSRGEFRKICQETLIQAGVKLIEIEEVKRELPEITTRFNYKTQYLGVFSEEKTFKLVKEDGFWKIDWDWNMLLNNFSPGNSVETKIIPGERGTIISHDGKILVADRIGTLVSVNANKVNPQFEEEMLNILSNLGYRIAIDFYHGYQENSLPDTWVPLITLWTPITEKLKNQLQSFSGIKLTPAPARIYYWASDPNSIENSFFEERWTRIYSAFNYHGVKWVEKKYDEQLSGQDGGKIVIKNQKGDIIRIVLEKEPRNGADIIISSDEDWNF